MYETLAVIYTLICLIFQNAEGKSSTKEKQEVILNTNHAGF